MLWRIKPMSENKVFKFKRKKVVDTPTKCLFFLHECSVFLHPKNFINHIPAHYQLYTEVA